MLAFRLGRLARPFATAHSACLRQLGFASADILDNLQVGLGAKSSASRLNPGGSAPLAGAKEVAVTPNEFAAGRPSPAFPRALASGPVRRGDAPVIRRAIRVA